MVNIKVNISNCDQCPYAQISKIYTGDSWDDVRKIHCSLLKEDVYSYLAWNDNSPIPENCPAKIEPENQ